MSSKIRVLSDDTINKIAAGEVIENPSSVVKELAENSIDAGATEITIEIREGGRQLIRVSDNGCGMNGDDALLCLERHATSKLKAVDDIEELATMGFRGEAMPSIASISKFTLLTRPSESALADQPGTMVIVDGGKIVKCCPVECSKGTTIEVKSIFFNVPVRRKFQKSPSYDAAEICRIVTLLALANPEIKFQLISNQETMISAPAFTKESFQEHLDERVRQILGADFSRGLCPLTGAADEYTLQGFLGLPAASKHNRTGQYLFINRRAVASQLVSYAIREGYGTMLGTGRHPVYVLHLTMPGNLVDVNVHPQKREVRLRQEHVLKGLIIRAVSDSLQRGGAKAFEFNPEASERQEISPFRVDPNIATAFGPPDFVPEISREPISFPSTNSWPPVPIPKSPCCGTQQATCQTETVEESVFQTPQIQPQLFEPSPEKKAVPKIVATVPRYLIAMPVERGGSSPSPVLCLIDQRAAHARIMFDKLQRKGELRFEMQALLIPYIFDLAPADAAFLKDRLTTLQKVGLQVKEFGPRTFMIDALPHLFGNVDIHQLIEEIIRNLRDLELSGIIEQELEKKIVLAASRAAISGERRLDLIEAQSLVEQLMECRMPDHCPSGKPIMLQLSLQQIASLFK